jgi:hypothetical protein
LHVPGDRVADAATLAERVERLCDRIAARARGTIRGHARRCDEPRLLHLDARELGAAILRMNENQSSTWTSSARREVAEHGWPLADENAYPVLLRMVDGKHAPVFERELKLATAIMRALGAFVLRHPWAFENYREEEICESHLDENDLEVILSVPHPRASSGGGSWQRPLRAQTLENQANPYGLPLEPSKLKNLVSTLGSFTLHRVLGLFCAVASVPQLPPPGAWVGEIMQHVKFASEDQARSILDRLMTIYNHVVTTLGQGDIDGLIPEAADVEGCREWARGYTTLLGRVDPADTEGDALDAAFAIQALAEIPQMLELLDEFRGEDSRENMLARYRESLADDAGFLLEAWGEARAQPPSRPPETTFRREITTDSEARFGSRMATRARSSQCGRVSPQSLSMAAHQDQRGHAAPCAGRRRPDRQDMPPEHAPR